MHILIIIPAYNEEFSIRSALDSILNQSYSNYSILCSDNNSSDATFNIMQSYKNKFEDMTIIRNDNTLDVYDHFLRCFHFAYENIDFDYFFFLCADDFLTSKYFLSELSLFSNDIVLPNFIANTGAQVQLKISKSRMNNVVNFFIKEEIVYIMLSMIKKELFLQVYEIVKKKNLLEKKNIIDRDIAWLLLQFTSNIQVLESTTIVKSTRGVRPKNEYYFPNSKKNINGLNNKFYEKIKTSILENVYHEKYSKKNLKVFMKILILNFISFIEIFHIVISRTSKTLRLSELKYIPHIITLAPLQLYLLYKNYIRSNHKTRPA